MNLEQIQAGILGLSNNEIDKIITTINFRRREIGNQIKGQFRIGDNVWFDKKRDGLRISGKVCKINRKNIQVRENDKNWMVWNVSPSLLTKESE